MIGKQTRSRDTSDETHRTRHWHASRTRHWYASGVACWTAFLAILGFPHCSARPRRIVSCSRAGFIGSWITSVVIAGGLLWPDASVRGQEPGSLTRSSLDLISMVRQAQGICYPESGFCITSPAIQDYFYAHGGVERLGYPISREFILEGWPVQVFQHAVLQLQGATVAVMDVPEPGIMPMTRAGEYVFPAADSSLVAAAPSPSDPAYPQLVLEFVGAVVPNEWAGLSVGLH